MEIGAIGSQNYNYSEIPKKVEKNSAPVEEKSETQTTMSTDEVDAEIEELKKRRLELKKNLQTSSDENLQKELSQIENELRLKDNDEYRKQHAKIISNIDLKVWKKFCEIKKLSQRQRSLRFFLFDSDKKFF